MTRDDGDTFPVRDQAIFEAGIKLGALYHQFTGAPISTTSIESMEKAIEQSIGLQPFVTSITVRINKNKVNSNLNEFGYCELEGPMLDVRLKTTIKNTTVTAQLSCDTELKYPLMKILHIEEQ